MVRIFAAIFALLISSCSSSPKAEAPRSNPIQLALSSSVAFMRYHAEESDNNESESDTPKDISPDVQSRAVLYGAYCAGVWVKSDLILTANHCAAGGAYFDKIKSLSPKEIMINEATGIIAPDPKTTLGVVMEYIVPSEANGIDGEPKSLHKGRVVAVSLEHDLALVHVDSLSAPLHISAPVARENPELAGEILTVGHPGGLLFSFEKASVAGYRDHMTSSFEKRRGIIGPFIQVSGFIWKGNSGGGMFNSRGELVSVVLFNAMAPNQCFGVQLSVIQDFMDRNAYKLY